MSKVVPTGAGGQFEKAARPAAICGLCAGAIALLALLSWVFGNWRIGALGAGYVPVAPATALMLMLLSGGLVMHSRWPGSRTVRRFAIFAVSGAVGLGVFIWAQRVLGVQASLEHWLAPPTYTAAGVPVGLMSPLTALTLRLAALAFLLEVPPFSRHRLSRWLVPTLALGSLLVSLAVLLSYLAGLPLLYGTRAIPMALPTAAALLLLSYGILTADRSIESAATQARPSALGRWGLLLSLVVALGIAGSAYTRQQNMEARRTVEREVSTIADLKAAQITNWWRERRSDAEVVFRTTMIQARALEFLSGSAPAGRDLLAWMEMRRELNHYHQLILYDARGIPRLAAPPNSSIPHTAHDREVQSALRTKGVSATDLHTHGEAAAGQRPLVTISLWIPIGVKPGTDASAAGALLVEIDPSQFLYPLIQSWPSSTRTAEALLIRREGDDVVYLNTLRHRADTELSFRLPVDRGQNLPASLAVLGKVGVVEGEDYRHVPVLAAVRAVPDTPWFLVAKVDQEEVYAPYRRRIWMTVIILLVSVLAAVLGAGLYSRRINTRLLLKQQVVDHDRNDDLEQRIKDRTVQLEASNRELESFCYSVSHDLRAPLRGIDGWSLALLEDYHDKLDEKGRRQLERVRAGTQRMGQLIDDLLLLARVTRGSIRHGPVDLTALAQSAAARLQEETPERGVEFVAQPGLTAQGDAHLLGIVLSNLLGNAWKFSGGRSPARVEFGRTEVDSRPAFFVRDNGVGFDMAYAQKLFGAFQRMHKASEFPGTGIGLATVQRVIQRHGGRVWAEAQVDRGATFYFTLEEAA
jgi:signal transduction histidine kinase